MARPAVSLTAPADDEPIATAVASLNPSAMAAATSVAEERYRTLVEKLPVAVYRTTPSGEILDANEATYLLLGYDSLDALRATRREANYAHPEDRIRIVSMINARGEVKGVESELRRSDGTTIWVREDARAVYDEDGRLKWIEGVMIDITDAKRAEQLRSESERSLRYVMENAPVLLFAVDANGVVTSVTGKGLEAVGMKPSEIVGRSVHDFPASHLVKTAAQATDGPPVIRSRTGRYLQYHYTVERGPNGEYLGAAGIAVDVTDRVRAAQASAKNEAKTKFLASMSHELRTPLNSILGFGQLLLDQRSARLDEKQERYVEHIVNSGKHLLELINEVLDLSKIDAGQMQLHVENLDLVQLVSEVASAIQPMAASRGHELVLEMPGSQSATVDGRRVRQIVLNLLSNAVKFTPDGGRIAVRLWSDDGDHLLSVADNGMGIAEGDLERIFDEFMQVEGGRSRNAEGTGLGLPVSRRLARMMGGDIVVTSRLGKGSTFQLRLPRSGEVEG